MSAVKCDTWTANKILHNEAGVDYDLKSLRPVISTFSILFLSSTVMVRERGCYDDCYSNHSHPTSNACCKVMKATGHNVGTGFIESMVEMVMPSITIGILLYTVRLEKFENHGQSG